MRTGVNRICGELRVANSLEECEGAFVDTLGRCPWFEGVDRRTHHEVWRDTGRDCGRMSRSHSKDDTLIYTPTHTASFKTGIYLYTPDSYWHPCYRRVPERLRKYLLRLLRYSRHRSEQGTEGRKCSSTSLSNRAPCTPQNTPIASISRLPVNRRGRGIADGRSWQTWESAGHTWDI